MLYQRMRKLVAIVPAARRGEHEAGRVRVFDRPQHVVGIAANDFLEHLERKTQADDRRRRQHFGRLFAEALQALLDNQSHAVGDGQILGDG